MILRKLLLSLALLVALAAGAQAADVFSTDSATPKRATVNGTAFFPRIAYDTTGDLGINFADQAVAARNLGQYRFTHYLNYQYGPLTQVLPQLTPLHSLGMWGFATGNGVTQYPVLTTPTALTATSGAAGNVDVGTHSYKVAFLVPCLFGGNPVVYPGGTTSSIVTVSTSAKQISLTNIPVGVPGTSGRYIYRTVAGDTGIHKLVTILANNTATTFTDNVADANLGANVPTGDPPLAVIDNPSVSGTPFRTYWNNTAAGAGGAYVLDEPQSQASGCGVFENALYWRGVMQSEMPNQPRLYVLFPEGPLTPETSPGSGIESQHGSVGFTEHLLSVANPYFWNRNLPAGGNDWIGDDIYVNFHNETTTGAGNCGTNCGVLEQGGFPHYLVADRAAHSVAAATASQKVPVITLQLFGPFQQGRFPTPNEMWQHVTMAIAEGIRGIAWWQIGTNTGLADQTEPTKTNANTALINITTFIQQNEATILSTPITGRLTNSTSTGNALNWRKGALPAAASGSRQTNDGDGGRGMYQAELNALNAGVTQWSPMLDQSGDVRHRVFRVGTSQSYVVFAYNYAPTARNSVTFTFDKPVASVTVVDEGRSIAPSGSTWTDNFGGSSSLTLGSSRNAHIYQVTTTGSPPYFNSSEAMCDGSDPTVLLCDDFSAGWYTQSATHGATCATSGNQNPSPTSNHGWCGSIGGADDFQPTTTTGFGFNGGAAATSKFNGSQGSANAGDHALKNFAAVTEWYYRMYYMAAANKTWGAQKFITFNSIDPGGGGIDIANTHFNCGAGPSTTGNPQLQVAGDANSCYAPNITPGFEIQRGRLYYIEVHVKLQPNATIPFGTCFGVGGHTPTGCPKTGTFEMWINDCGTNPAAPTCTTALGATPTLRSQYTNVGYPRRDSSAPNFTNFVVDQWANPASTGNDYISNLVVRTTPIGFAGAAAPPPPPPPTPPAPPTGFRFGASLMPPDEIMAGLR